VKHVWLACLVAAMAISCDLFTPMLHVVVWNGTGIEIENVSVSFADHEIPTGVMAAGTHKSYGPIVDDVPTDATISWQTADGHQHIQRVDVRARIRENRSGDVVFKIVDERVEVSFERP
jgi:hypothetical protein